MVDVHVEAHPDGVRRHQKIHLSLLIQRHLGVPRPRAEAAHHDRATAFAAPDQFGDGVDLGGTESDHGGARRQTHEFGRPRVGQLRQTGPRLNGRVRHQAAQQRADRLGAEEHRLDHAAGVQQALGEHVATVGIGAKLDLVDRDELDIAVERHRLHRAGEPFGVGRDDLFLPRNQGDAPRTFAGDHAIVVLPREQAQREADDAGGVAEHPLHGKMRLAGIRRTEDGLHAGGETGIQAVHGRMFVRRGEECMGFWGDRAGLYATDAHPAVLLSLRVAPDPLGAVTIDSTGW